MKHKTSIEIRHRRKYQDMRRMDFLQEVGKSQDTATYDARMRFKSPSYYQREGKRNETEASGERARQDNQ